MPRSTVFSPKNLTPKERLVYWIKERHKIFLNKQAGKRKPGDELCLV